MLKRLFLLATVVLALLMSPEARAADKRTRIRDAEVENTIRTFGTPLFEAAGLDPNAIQLYILNDNSLNAFVAGGQNMFIHTGLLIRAETPNQLIGVMAHETGHIAGGHLIRGSDAMANASTEALIGMLLGAAAGVASGRGDVGAAVSMGSTDAAMRNFLAFNRSQEQQADQMAIRFLDQTHQSPKGLLEFFEILGDQELLVTTRQDPYVRTHPLTRDRVSFVREEAGRSRWNNAPTPPAWIEMHKRMRAKLFAFIEPTMRVLQRYKAEDTSMEARYARAIAYYRKPDMEQALPLVDGLIAERPTDPYFWELKGQMLFETARGAEAIEPYRKAVKLLPGNALLRAELGQVLVEQEDPSLLKEAQSNLKIATEKEPEEASHWHFLGIAYGRDGNEGMAAYAMAEEALLNGQLAEANYHVTKAEKLLPKTGPMWLRIQDIKERAQQVKDDMRRR